MSLKRMRSKRRGVSYYPKFRPIGDATNEIEILSVLGYAQKPVAVSRELSETARCHYPLNRVICRVVRQEVER